jgi:adenylate cyclase
MVNHRKLAAILCADVVSYSRLMTDDEAATLRSLNEARDIFSKRVEAHGGRLIDTAGDSILAEFPSAVEAVDCASEIQHELAKRNSQLAEHRRMHFRIGINLGDVIEQGDGTIYGDGVNVAARLQTLAEFGGICTSGTVYDQVEGKLPFQFKFVGEQQVKNIDKPVRVYRAVFGTTYAVSKSGSKWLRTIVAGATVGLVIAIGFSIAWKLLPPRTERASTVADQISAIPSGPAIAVLAFDNLSDDPKQDFLSDGLAEEIITALSKVRGLLVIARNSSFQYKGKPVDVRKIAQELGVRYVLEGSVRKSDNRVRVTAQLIEATTGNHLWAERYERSLKDIFELQDEITRKIVSALDVQMVEGNQALTWRRTTDNLEAYEAFMRGREHLILLTREELAISRQYLEKAIKLDPKFALAHTQLASYHFLQTLFGFSESPSQDLERAFALQKKAIALDDSQGFSYAQLGRLYVETHELEKARAAGKKGVDIEPSGGESNAIYGYILEVSGKPEECLAYINRALRLQPFPNPWYPWLQGRCLRHLGRYEEAIASIKRAIALSPSVVFIRAYLVETYVAAGRLEEARAEAKEVLALDPKFSVAPFVKLWDKYDDPNVVKGYAANLRKAGLT